MERSRAVGGGRLPGAPDEVDVAFIGGVLESHGLPHDLSDVAWERIGTDTGISSLVGRVRLRYRGDEAGPDRLVVKLAAQPLTRERDTVEVRFYDTIAADCPLAAPRCLFARYDLDDGRLAIVLEDLEGLESPGDVAGLDIPRARAAARALAAFHARFGPVGEAHAWTCELDDGEAERMEEGLARNLARTLERSGDRLAPEQAAVCRRLPGQVGRMMALLSEPPRTLTHSDYRADNLFFRPDGRVIAVDWEGLTRQRGGFDLGMFLGTSLRDDDFADHAEDLLGIYADGVRLGGFDYPRREIERDVRLGVLVQLVWASYVFCEPALGTGRPLRVVEAWLDRLTRAAIRLDAFAALAGA